MFITLSGLAITILGLYLWQKAEHLLQNGVKVEGIIYKLVEKASSENSIFYPVVRFKTVENDEWITQETGIGTNPPLYREGQKVTVIYDPEEPTNLAIVSVFSQVWLPRLLVAAGGALLVYGLLNL